ncbi:ras-related protein Rab-1D-like [Clytia hemisphaerica]|uniref:Uncharacterized protein n=1 Tax=Clytia hemisphaerica TaxID=252671 RepID=A0A7M5WTD0_9CNID
MPGESSATPTNYQLVLLGDHGAGKSSIFTRFKEDPFKTTFEDYSFDQTIKEFTRNNRQMQLQLYDTAGMERAGDMTSSYFRTVDGVLLVYSCTDNETLVNIKSRWVENCKRYCKDNTLFFVVGTKIDNCDSITVKEDYPKEMLQSLPIKIENFYRISSKEGTNFDSFIDNVIDIILANRDVNGNDIPDGGRVDITKHCEKKSSCGCS